MATFPWYWHPWASRWQKYLNLSLRIYFTENLAFRKPFHQLLFPAMNKLLPERYFINQLNRNCTKIAFEKLRQRVKISIPFFHSNIYHFNVCCPTFSDKAVTNFCSCSGAWSINVKINSATGLEMVWITQVSSSLSVVLAGHFCAVSVSVFVEQRKEKSWKNQLS